MLNQNFINEEIKGLIICFLTGDINHDQLVTLNHWINESDENKKLFDTYKSTWILSGMANTQDLFQGNKVWETLQTKLNFEIEDSESTIANKRYVLFKRFRTAAIWILFLDLAVSSHISSQQTGLAKIIRQKSLFPMERRLQLNCPMAPLFS